MKQPSSSELNNLSREDMAAIIRKRSTTGTLMELITGLRMEPR